MNTVYLFIMLFGPAHATTIEVASHEACIEAMAWAKSNAKTKKIPMVCGCFVKIGGPNLGT